MSRKTPKQIRTLIFDLFGTLVTSGSDAFREPWDVIGGYEPYALKYKDYLMTTDFPSMEHAIVDVTSKEKMDVTDSQLERFVEGIDNWKSRVRLYPGARDLLSSLKDSGYTLALLSNQSVFSESVDADRGITEYFDVIVRSHKVGLAKPDHSIYTLLLKELGVAADDAIMVGNDFDCDVIAPLDIGLRSVLFDSRNDYQGFEPRVRSWKDFEERYT